MSRLRLLWTRIHTSLWFLPSMLTAGSIGLAFITLAVDRSGSLNGLDSRFLFGAGAEGARGVLGTIAGSIITVTGVVFSITIVVLQLASSQFTPRVLQNFTEDRANQLVLGVFIGTFTYSLLVLRTVRSAFADYERFVPALSVTIALLLALISIGFLIFFVNHIARSIQAEIIIDRATQNARRVVEHLFPQELGSPGEAGPELRDVEAQPGAPVQVGKSGYLASVDEDRVLAVASENGLVVRMERRIGEFLLEGDAVFSVLPESTAPGVLAEVRACASLSAERTRHQDLERSLIELTDIGIKALSPSLNDPTTAATSVDRMTEVLSLLATRAFPSLERVGGDGEVRFLARRDSFEDIIAAAYGPLMHHARRDPFVSERIGHSLRVLLARAPASRRPPLAAQLARLESALAAPGAPARPEPLPSQDGFE